MQVEVRLFGAPSISVGGRTIQVRRRKTRGLLFVLVAEADAPSREQLASVIWPELELDRALRALRGALAELRQHLGAETLSSEGTTIAPRGITVDVRTLAQARRAFLEDPTAERTQALERALELVRGPLLEGFDLDGERFASWKATLVRQLEIHVGECFQRLIEQLEARGELTRALGHARSFAAAEPHSELAHRHAIRLFAKTGRSSEAYRQYELCRRILRERFAVEPSLETRRLVRELHERELQRSSEAALATVIDAEPARAAPEAAYPAPLRPALLAAEHPLPTAAIERVVAEVTSLFAEHAAI
ncbi:hypothetical protein L6R52_39300, partial [Myxococcota bacterium]|nr:hypothetical protein [Myxococcota bacterium]